MHSYSITTAAQFPITRAAAGRKAKEELFVPHRFFLINVHSRAFVLVKTAAVKSDPRLVVGDKYATAYLL